MPDAAVQCSAIIVNYNGGDDLLGCLETLERQISTRVEVIIVDNRSTDGSIDRAANAFPDARIVRSPTNLGFAGGCNRGAREAHGDVLLFLNPDVLLDATCVARLCERLRTHPGVAGPKLFIEASGDCEYGVALDLVGFPIGLRKPGKPLYVAGCALATDRETFSLLGGFDERYFMIYEDADYCWRALLAGRDVTVVAQSDTVHKGGGSTPGGYVREGRREVSAFRLPLFERNRLATLLKCAPAMWLVFAVPACVFSSLVITGWAYTRGERALARSIAAGVAWNARQLKTTLQMRRSTPLATSRRGAIRRRIVGQLDAVMSVFRHGPPQLVKAA